MKKVLVYVLILSMMLSVVGCSKANNDNSSVEDQKVEIVYVNEGERKPITSEERQVDKDKALTATLVVDVRTILQNKDKLNKDKAEFVPEDGYILGPIKVEFNEGETVYDVLQRELKKRKIHMEVVKSPIDNSVFTEGINNIYKLDCGEQSGWLYKVNKWFPYYGYDQYKLQNNDVVEVAYTCDFGKDVGFVMDMGEGDGK